MKKTTKMEILTLLFLLINILKTSAQDSRKPFSQSSYPSLPYVEVVSLGTVRFIWGRYEIVSYFDLDEFNEEEEVIRGKIKEVETACKNFSPCQQQHLIDRLKFQLEECVESNFKMFSSLGRNSMFEKKNDANNHRQKRTLLPFMKDPRKDWRILDEDHAKIYDQLISEFRSSTINMTVMLDKQIVMMKMALSRIDGFNEKFDKNIKILNDATEQLHREVGDLAHDISKSQWDQMITKACVEIGIATMELDKNINIVLESITMGSRGTINPKLLTPKILVEGITAIMKEQEPVNIPIELHDENYFEYLQISEIAIDVIDRSLVYVVQVPVLQPESFSVYQILPVPKSLNNGTAIVYVDIEDEYIITDVERKRIIPIDKKFLSDCKKYKSSYFCNHAGVDITKETKDSCLRSLLDVNSEIEVKNCQLKMADASKSLWIPLPSGNEWVYVVNLKERIHIQCEGTNEPVTVSGTGKLKVKPGCVVVGVGLKLYSQFVRRIDKNYTIPLIDFHFKENVTLLFEASNYDFALVKLPKINKQVVHAGEFTEVGEKLDVVSKKIQDVRDKIIKEEESMWNFSFPWWQKILMGGAGLLFLYIISRIIFRTRTRS